MGRKGFQNAMLIQCLLKEREKEGLSGKKLIPQCSFTKMLGMPMACPQQKSFPLHQGLANFPVKGQC